MSYASCMRVAGALLFVGGCIADPGYGNGYPGYDPGSNPNPGNNGGCHQDSDCGSGSLICARDFSCVSKSETYTAHISWTIGAQPASKTTCAHLPDLDLQFRTTDNYFFGFSPIACDQGKFTIDKLPTWYVETTIGPTGSSGTLARIDPITGIATLDLPY